LGTAATYQADGRALEDHMSMNITTIDTRSTAASGEMNTASEGYTSAPGAQHLGTALLALTELVTHIETGRQRGAIHYHYADRLAVHIAIMADALNALIPRPRQGRGLARWAHVEGRP
jgi:hypothetical protein